MTKLLAWSKAAAGLRIGFFCCFASLLVAGLPAQAADNPLSLRAHHITAAVADLPRAIGWYQSILGFKLKDRGNHGDMQYAVLGIPGFDVALVTARGPRRSPAREEGSEPRWIHIVFSAPDPDRLFKDLKARGANPYIRGGESGAPLKSFLIQDSEGNEIEIIAAE